MIATIAAPTILVEPEKTEESTAEGEIPAEGAAEGTAEIATSTEEGKEKSTKPTDDKTITASGDKGKSVTKEKEIKKK